jgi:hypothetical protein
LQPTGEEEVYLTTVVVRRPARYGRAAIDHARLSSAILQCMAAQAQSNYAADVDWRPFPAADRRYPNRPSRRQYTVQPVYLGLSLLCLVVTGYCLFALLR